MPKQFRAVAFDLDATSVGSLREAFPEWHIDVIDGATAASLAQDSSLGTADLLVVMARAEAAPQLRTRSAATEMLGLCRGLRSQSGGASTPLVVLVPPTQEAIVRAVLKAGADRCMILPVHVKQLVSVVNHLQRGNQPGRHTLNLEPAQTEDSWRDDGGQG